SNINLFVEGMLEQPDPQPHPSNWLTNWKRMDEEACRILSKHDSDGLTEGETVAQLTNLLSENELLFVGNSMAIRDVDTFMINVQKKLRIMGNRGANGIDGVVSTAAGTAKTGKHRSEEHTSELQSRFDLVCRLLLE